MRSWTIYALTLWVSLPTALFQVSTPGGRFYAEWDEDMPRTRDGQLIFFFQFSKAGGRWEQLKEHCPLSYSGNRGSGAHNVIGTILLSVLSGHWRYAHINSVRGDSINLPAPVVRRAAHDE